jgi:general secretion pathway protein J
MRRARRGLTLMEVMIAIGIVLMITTIGWSAVEDAVELNDVLQMNDATTRQARVSLSRLRRELQLAYLTPNRPGSVDPSNVQSGAIDPSTPVVLGEPTYQTVFVGENQDPDRIWFASLAHQRLYHNSRECDQTEVTVWGDRAKREQGVGNVLYHRESQRIDGEPDEDGRIWPLAYNIRSFDLRYLDGQTFEWFDTWDTRSADTPYRLPRAVQVGIVFLAPDPDDPKDTIDAPFLTTIPLQYADPVTPKFGTDLLNAAGGVPGAPGMPGATGAPNMGGGAPARPGGR